MYLCLVCFCLFLFILLDSGELLTSGQGNAIRFYALQAVSAKAMRTAINSLPYTFEQNIKKVKKQCISNARKPWAKQILSSNYTYFCFQ